MTTLPTLSTALGNLHVTMHQQPAYVTAYGATGDGVTDDTAAIQAAVTALGSNGGVLLFPAGTYKVTSTITDNGAPVVFRGHGPKSIISGAAGTTILKLTYGGGFSFALGSAVEDLTVTCGSPNSSTIAIDVNNGSSGTSNWALKNVMVLGASLLGSAAGYGIRLVGALKGTLHNVVSQGWGSALRTEVGGSIPCNANSTGGLKLRVSTIGLDITATSVGDFYLGPGDTIEACTTGVSHLSGRLITLGTHFENDGAGTGTNVSITSATFLSYGCTYSSAAANGDIVVNAGAGSSVATFGDTYGSGLTNNAGPVFVVHEPKASPALTGSGPFQVTKTGVITGTTGPGQFSIVGMQLRFDTSLRANAAALFQTTVGAAGGGSALPGNPVKYLKVLDDSGNTFVIPVYNP